MTTSITDDHCRAIEAPTIDEAGSFCPCSCLVSGEPAAAIATRTVCLLAEDGSEP